MLLNIHLKNQCTRFLGSTQKSHRDWLQTMQQSSWLDAQTDYYNSGPLVEELEKRAAKLLGKPKAVFFHKATTAQQILLKLWSEKAGCSNVVLHPKSHLHADESDAYQTLSGLKGLLLGSDHEHFGIEDLEALKTPVGVVSVELPLSRIGFRLMPWETLEKVKSWTKAQGAFLHVDGARLWESTTHYDKPLHEIAAQADSVYCSFYKGLSGMGGCIVAGPEDVMEAATEWRGRFGGDLFTAFPFLITALEGLENNLPKLPGYVQRAQEIAQALRHMDRVRLPIDAPHTNEFRIFLEGNAQELAKRYTAIVEKEKTWIFGGLEPTAVPGWSMANISVGDGSAEVETEEALYLLERVIQG